MKSKLEPTVDYDVAATQSGLRVATLNLYGMREQWAERRQVLIDGFRDLHPDVIAFQEAIVVDDYDQVADVLGDSYHVMHRSDRTADGSGASIASRWRPDSVQELDLPIPTEVTSAPQWMGNLSLVELAIPGPLGAVVFAHQTTAFQWGHEYDRERQAIVAARFIEEHVAGRYVHVVVAGDFNAVPESASMRFWSGRQSLDGTSVCYQDAWAILCPEQPGHTFTPRNPLVAGGEMPLERGRRIDYILVRCGDYGPTLDVTACDRCFNQPVAGVWASDHFGVVADLAVPTGPERVAYPRRTPASANR